MPGSLWSGRCVPVACLYRQVAGLDMRVFSGKSSSPRVSIKLAIRGLTSSTNGSRELPEMMKSSA